MSVKPRDRRRGQWVVGCALLLLALRAPTTASADGVRVGDRLPEVRLTDLEGARRSVGWAGEGAAATVFFFFDPQSPDSLLEMSFLDALYGRARDFGLAVYAVDGQGRQPAEVARSLERYRLLYRGPSFPVGADADFRLGKLFGADRAPLSFLADARGVVQSRVEGFGPAAAVELVRRIERLVRRPEGDFSFALREAQVDEAEERRLGERVFAAPEKAEAAPRPLAAGEKVPVLSFGDLDGQTHAWAWGEGAPVLRVVLFWRGLDLPSTEALTFVDELAARGRDAGLEAAAVEASGLSPAEVGRALERYRRLHPSPSFLPVPDPAGRVRGLLGAGAPLPQIFVVGGDGTVIVRVDGFGGEDAGALTERVERAFRVSGRPLAPALRGPEAVGATGAPGGEEAPSIRERRERDEAFRAGLVQGDYYFTNWDFDQALPYYRRCLEIAPRDLHVLVRLAQIYERKGEPRLALEFWERVLSVRPGHGEARTRVEELRGRRGPAD